MNLNKEAIRLLDRLYKDLYLNEQVLHHATGNKYDKFNNIASYLNKLESTHNKISTSDKHIKYLKKCYYDKYIIKREDIPESYYKNQEQMYLERGYGHINITGEQKNELQNEVIENQKRSLDTWIDYFLSDDSNVYPFWTKYWAFQGMLNLGYFDKENGKFYKRTKNTVYPFCDLNREALAMSIDLLIKSLNKEIIQDKDLEILVKSGSFQKIYTYILTKVLHNNKNITKRNDGKWVKYDQGSDHMPLVNSLKGYNTGWCTAGESTAESQLQGGDFYVYYTLDDNDEYKVPRIAIRMERGSIGEIRGIAQNQNIESEMEKVVEEKIKDFPDKDLYYKKVNDMSILTEIYKKWQNDIELNKEELKFIYEINNKIEGFGYAEDPRIGEILEKRDKRKDLSNAFDCKEEQIALNIYDFNNNKNIIYYDDNLTAKNKNVKKITSLRYIKGEFGFYNQKKIKNFIFPETVYKDLDLHELEKAKNITLPKYVGGDIILDSLKITKNITLPEYIGGDIILKSIKKHNGLVFPKYMNGTLVITNLKNARGLVLPERIGKSLFLWDLENPQELHLPNYVGENLDLSGLRRVQNLRLPNYVGGCLELNGLNIAEGLVLPEHFGALYLKRLKSIEGLNLPETINGTLNLSGLEYIDEFIFPKYINGVLNLMYLKKANKLVLPDIVTECVKLHNFSDIENLVLPEELTYTIYMKDFTITRENVDEYRSKQKTYKK